MACTHVANSPLALDSILRGSKGSCFAYWVAGVSGRDSSGSPSSALAPRGATLEEEVTPPSLGFFFEASAVALSVIFSMTSLTTFRPPSLSGSKLQDSKPRIEARLDKGEEGKRRGCNSAYEEQTTNTLLQLLLYGSPAYTAKNVCQKEMTSLVVVIMLTFSIVGVLKYISSHSVNKLQRRETLTKKKPVCPNSPVQPICYRWVEEECSDDFCGRGSLEADPLSYPLGIAAHVAKQHGHRFLQLNQRLRCCSCS